ncbi:MAG: hypothetical protein MHMPM18_001304 [Marteilia pararefringens]
MSQNFLHSATSSSSNSQDAGDNNCGEKTAAVEYYEYMQQLSNQRPAEKITMEDRIEMIRNIYLGNDFDSLQFSSCCHHDGQRCSYTNANIDSSANPHPYENSLDINGLNNDQSGANNEFYWP